MRLNYIELRNYRRFKDLRIELPSDGIIGILGPNGCGKTTIIEAVAWALFGNVDEVVRDSKDGVRRSAASASEKVSVTIGFELGGTDYRLEREMTGKNLTMRAALKTKDKDLAQGDRDVKRYVEKLLGMDYKSFFTSVFARQKELDALQDAKPGERKKAVLRMLRIDGIDVVLQTVRGEANGIEKRIEGATSTLYDENGNDKEAALTQKLPALKASLELAARTLREAEEKEEGANRALEQAKATRDKLKKDADAFAESQKDLTARRATAVELGKRVKRTEDAIEAAKSRLQKLPELRKLDEEFLLVEERREKLENERLKDEKARAIGRDVLLLREEEKAKEIALLKAKADMGKAGDVSSQLEDLERQRAEDERRASDITSVVGELRQKAREKEQSADKDGKKLKEIASAGRDGECPTCERRLEDAFDLLMRKLTESSEQAAREAAEARSKISGLDKELEALRRKGEALKKKRGSLEKERTRYTELETSAKGYERELYEIESKLSRKTIERQAIGEIEFSEGGYESVRKEYAKLKPAHDEFVKTKALEDEFARLTKELDDARAATRRVETEMGSLERIVKELEPKKEQYGLSSRTVDEKMRELSSAKDASRTAHAARDKAHNELSTADRELKGIEQTKKGIEQDRMRIDDLSLLEQTLVGFKDHLITRIAPTLSELTSRAIESMTEGRYSNVALDEDYKIMIDDQGTQYPVTRFSGGESDIANLALRLAISRIIADRTGAAPINFLILDEIFGSLDPARKRSVMSALAGISAQFRQIFLITHVEEIKDLMTHVISVQETEDGGSRAAFNA
jgi:exonuclease SbcC